MAKRLLTPLRLIARMNFSLKNYSCELFKVIGIRPMAHVLNTGPLEGI